jgi:flagellar biosynthesis protein FliR
MATFQLLDHFVLSQLFTFIIVFCRIGSCIMTLPGFGDVYILPRARLLLSLAISLMLTPMLTAQMPPISGSPLALALLIISEVLIGVFFGLLVRVLISAMNVAGTIIANQSSLAIASVFEATAGMQSVIVSNMFTLTALTLFFVLNLHHIMLAAIINSYSVFTPGDWLPMDDMSNQYGRMLMDAFVVGVQFAAPHIIMSLIIYLAGGVMTRLMPTFQVFFILMSPQIMMALLLIIVIISPMMMLYVNYVEEQLLGLTSSITGAK